MSREAGARGRDHDRLEMQATEIGRLGSEQNEVQVGYVTLKAEQAALRNV
jgi:hypothetical protein